MRETVADGGLPCPNCSTLTELHMSSSKHLGQVALLQIVREASADGKTLNAEGIPVRLVIRVVGALRSSTYWEKGCYMSSSLLPLAPRYTC